MQTYLSQKINKCQVIKFHLDFWRFSVLCCYHHCGMKNSFLSATAFIYKANSANVIFAKWRCEYMTLDQKMPWHPWINSHDILPCFFSTYTIVQKDVYQVWPVPASTTVDNTLLGCSL